MGRRPIGRKAMTDAQRQRRKARQQKEQALRLAKGAVKRARRDEMEAALATRTEAASSMPVMRDHGSHRHGGSA